MRHLLSVTRDGERKIGRSVGSVHGLERLPSLGRRQPDLLLDVVDVDERSHRRVTVLVDRAFEICRETKYVTWYNSKNYIAVINF